ncbi:phage tail tape measure protein [Brevibacterium sp. BDJS002]|uniref:phage tail tape measure protein n=1 Tax=Brevibacterium sp. BDJS002 TaxID=3020906 RepID=UPI0023072E18|nr:phage tail tape measure protein [Brevibacterium sp. BDJS002]WCE39116.1 phage tail tape measure protein [Brevibacterium sp. BDJS002]
MVEVRSTKVVLSAKVDAFKADMAAASKSAMDAAQKTETAWDKSSTGAGKSMAAIGKYSGEMTTAGTAMATFGGVVVGSLGLATKAAMSWESAWTGVLKTVDGSPKQLAAVESGLRDLAKTLPATHEEIAAVAEAAGQLGIKTDNVVSFTKTMIDMGESTNISAEEAATSLARLANIMGTSQKDFGKMGASIVGLGNNFATTEAEIVGMSMRIAAVGKQSGLSEGEVFGLATALSSVGIEAEAGGTAMSLVMKKITKAVGEGGAGLDEFARISGMSSSQFAQAWQKDASGALSTFVTGLGEADASGENVNQTLSDLGITGIRESDALLRLSGASDVLTDALKQGNDEYERGTALAQEAAKRYETAESKIKIAGNSLKDTAITIGGTFLPALASVAEGAAQLATAFGDLPEPVLKTSAALGAIAGTAALAGGAALILVPRIAETVTAITTLKAAAAASTGTLGKFSGALGALGPAAAGAAIGLTAFAVSKQLADAGLGKLENTQEAVTQLAQLRSEGGLTAEALDEMFTANGNAVIGITGFGDALKRTDVNPLMEGLSELGTGFGLFADTRADVATQQLEKFDSVLAATAQSGDPELLAASFQTMVDSGDEFGYTAEDIINKMPELKAQLVATAAEWGVSADNATLAQIALGEITGPAGEASSAIAGVGGAAKDAAGGMQEMLEGLLSLGIIQQSEMEAMASYEAAIDAVGDAVKENGRTLDITTEKGRANRDVLFGIADAGRESADRMAENGASQEDLQKHLQRTYDDLVGTAKKFGQNADEADAMARKVLGIPDDVSVKTWMSDAASEQAKKTKKDVDNIPKSVTVQVHFNVNEPKNGIKNMPENLLNPNRNRSKQPGSLNQWGPKAAGGIDLMPMAAGGVHSNIAEMVKPNTWRVVGDRMDVDEAFIPLDGSKRSWKIMMEALTRMPGATPMARGGVLSGSSKADEEQRKLERERLKAIREMQADLRQDLRRGSIRDQVTSGLSGGLSAVDQLSRYGSDENLSRGSKSRATSSARKFESNLNSLYNQAERIDAKLEKAKDKAQELKGIKDSVASGLLNDRDLDVSTDVVSTGDGNFKQVSSLSSMTGKTARLKELVNKLGKLSKMGIPGALLQEVAGQGIEGGNAAADALLGAPVGERNQLVSSWAEFDKYAGQAGQYVTEGFYKGGSAAADGVVKGLEGRQKNVESAIANLAKVMESTFKSVLGIHSPSTVMAELGGFTAEGLVQGMLGGVADVQSAASMLGGAAVPALGDMSTSVDVGVNPVVADDEGMAGLAMQDMSATTLDAMEQMRVGVSDGWAAMLLNMQETQAGMLLGTQTTNAGQLLDTQTQQAAMLLNTQTQNAAMLLDVQTQQEAMRLNVATKQAGQKTVATEQQELMRLMLIDKQSQMKTKSAEDFESLKTTTGIKFGDMRKATDGTMSGMYGDYDTRLGDLKRLNKSGFESVLDTSNKNMKGVRDGIDGQMEKAKPELGNRLNSLIGVLSKFTASVNKAFGDVGVKLDAPAALKFESGGVMPGYSPGRDIHQFRSPTAGELYLSGGEAIMRPEWTRAMGGEQGVKAQNDAARQGRLDDLLHMQGNAFASGGVFGPVPGVNAFADSGVWRNLWAITKEKFPNATLNSAYRGGSITASGNTSHHSRGNAIDTSPSMDIFNFWRNTYGSDLAELIYSPANGKQIKNGQNYMYTGAVRGMHFNHVHIAAVKALSEAMAGGLPGMGGAMSHPFLDRAGVKPGDNMAKSYEAAAKKLTEQIYAKHSKMLPDGYMGGLGKGIMSQVSEGLVGKAKDYGKNAGSADFSNVAAGPVKSMAKQMLEQMGWGDQFGDLNWLLTRESGWNPNAQNPSSSAYGLFQFLNGTWGTVGGSKTSDPKMQLEYGLKYIKQRYGDVQGARSFWERNHWYEQGTDSAKSGWAVVGENGPELVNLSGGEQIHNAAESRKLLAENRTFIPHTGGGFDASAIGSSIAAEIKNNQFTPSELAKALDGVPVSLVVDGKQMQAHISTTVGSIAVGAGRAH